MKVERNLFLVLVPFFVVVGAIYGVLTGFKELVGVFGLLLTGALALMLAVYLTVTARQFTNRPEDNPAANIDAIEGDYGHFTPSSWWPLWLAGAGALCFMGLAVGWWLFIIGATFGIVALIGWTFESFHGENAV